MPRFTITGDNDPFLHVSLRRGESITCESNSMVMMEANLELAGEMKTAVGSGEPGLFEKFKKFFE